MEEPIWIMDEFVGMIHQRQLLEHGGQGGVRDPGLLESALARPKNLFYYQSEDVDIARLAASYAFGIAKNHAFVDGNKRTAFVVCLTFLQLNGCLLDVSQSEKYSMFLNLADGEVSEEELAIWIRDRIKIIPIES
jgi:death-on-curing protein